MFDFRLGWINRLDFIFLFFIKSPIKTVVSLCLYSKFTNFGFITNKLSLHLSNIKNNKHIKSKIMRLLY